VPTRDMPMVAAVRDKTAGLHLASRASTATEAQTPPRSASSSVRARAYFLDFLILAVLLQAFLMFAETVGVPAVAGLPLICLGLGVLVAYEPVLVHVWGGTLGHQWMNLRVVDHAGRHLPLWKAVIRTAIKWATIVYVAPIMIGLGRKQALWDLPVGSTVVVQSASRNK
jgi:uncharacterized RDD family membrane protein YckC